MLLAGEVGKPHGLTGEVYVVVISDDPQRFAPGSSLSRADGTILTVVTARPHGGRFLVGFEGIDSRDDAVSLRGPLYVPATAIRTLEPDEYWHDDLVDCVVVTDRDEEVGTVTDVVAGPAQDRLEVETPNGPRSIPLVKGIVTSIDTNARRIVIDPPDGLLD